MRLILKGFQDNTTTEADRFRGTEESRPHGKSEKLSSEDLYKRKFLEKKRTEESSSRGEIFDGKKVTIEDVTSEEPTNQDCHDFQVEFNRNKIQMQCI